MKLLFIGLRRSGNHGILGWIYGMMRTYTHFNDVPIGRFNRVAYDRNIDIRAKPLNTWINNRFQKFNPNHNLIVSLENQKLDQIANKLIGFRTVGFKKIILLRNPYNMMASTYQIQNKSKLENIVRVKLLWKEYAKEVLKETKHIDNYMFILYDKWYTDREYRRSIAKYLGLQYNEVNLNKIIGWARSSFRERNKDPRKMDVLNRMDAFKDDPVFMDVATDLELEELWIRVRTLANFDQ